MKLLYGPTSHVGYAEYRSDESDAEDLPDMALVDPLLGATAFVPEPGP
jgi:hypothetical protein